MNNASFGMSIQKHICNKYNLETNEYARSQFDSNSMEISKENLKIINKIFKELKDTPIHCATLEKSKKKGERDKPYNFIMKSGKTLSIKTNKKKAAMVCPNIVGQAGYDALNYHFGHFSDDTT